jgi:4-amino-4-deoxy-L-arabinose transferase-like glycosyltransferase
MTKTQLKKFLPQIVLVIIVGIALFLRLHQIDKSVWRQSGYDESRDMLVAEHIISYGENVSSGPLVSGGMNWLRNSPVYYYFVALIWFFTKNPIIFMYVWALIMTIPVLIAYFIGKKAKDNLTGLILASLLAFNQQMIYRSRELSQPHLLIIFAVAFAWSMLSYLKSKKNHVRYLLLSIAFLFLPLHFHYGIIASLPIGSLLIIYYLFKKNKKEKNFFIGILIPIVAFVSIFWSWIVLTYTNFPFDQIYFFTKNFENSYALSPLAQLQKVIAMLAEMIWSSDFSTLASGIFILVFLFLIKEMFGNKKNKEVFIFIVSMCSSVLLCVLYKHRVAETYLLFIFPFFLILIGFILRLFIEKKPILGWFLTILSLSIMLNIGIKKTFEILPPQSYYDQQLNISKIIYKDYLNKNLTTDNSIPDLLISWYTTTKNMPFDGWGSSGIWYFLEKEFDQKLITNTNYGLSHTPDNKYPQIIYMICDHRFNRESIQKECVDRFEKSYLIDKNSLEQISKGENLSLWSALLKNGKKEATRNVTHFDMMN